MKREMKMPLVVASLAIAFSSPITAQDLDADERGLIGSTSETSEARLAQELSNPVAPIISVPLQFNYNHGLGKGDGKRYGVTVSPVIPFQLSDDWNLISRTVIPIVRQDDVTPDGKSQFGFGPVVQSLFFSPITDSDFIWGAGPVLALPTATDGLPGDEWGAGITGVGLVQKGNWTVGALANHVWSITGDSASNTFIQPYVAYTTETAWTFLLNTESIYNWKTSEWTVPINANVSKLVNIGGRDLSLGGGIRYWADAPEGGPTGWGVTLDLTFLFGI